MTITLDFLFRMLRARARDSLSRTDMGLVKVVPLGPPATEQQISETTAELGFALYPLHAAFLTQVGNGGFGPGAGLIGVRGGTGDSHGRTLVELRDDLDALCGIPRRVVPLCEWDFDVFACLDCVTGRVLALGDWGLGVTPWSLLDWMAEWACDADRCEALELVRRNLQLRSFGTMGFEPYAAE